MKMELTESTHNFRLQHVITRSLRYASILSELHVDLTVYQTQELNEIEWRHPTTSEKEMDKRLITPSWSKCDGGGIEQVPWD
jgi:hypothetical protein